jgi:nanoRNase/pAp phosphatase (c-di-AMP/oligoRNAs hydrolase)
MGEAQASESNPIHQDRLDLLRSVVGAGPVLVLTHDNPDPDALASGKGLACLLRSAWGVPSRLVYSGLIDRAENRAMLRILTPEWEPAEVLNDLEQYSALALVDTQPGGGNNRLPAGLTPHIVIDHHYPIQGELDRVAYVDVRPEVGATVSLVYQYLEAAGVDPDATLATAMFYGIQADTRGLSRGDSPIDQAAYFKLLTLINRRVLARIELAGLPQDYFRALSNGLKAARVYGQVVVAYLGAMLRPDFMAEMADLLIRLENTHAVLCLGYHGMSMYLSLRTGGRGLDAGSLIQEVILAPGKAGGHGTVAGGQVPLGGLQPDAVAAEIEGRFLKVMGEGGEGALLLM